jgi:AraC-like DNA-binding protein
MKPILFHNPKAIKESFYLQEDVVPHFYDTLHYHPEFQLTLILKGTGNVLIGDYIGRFKPNEIYFIGPNVSHVFRNDNEYYDPKNKLKAHGVSIYFTDITFGSLFFDLPENKDISDLLKIAQKGLKCFGEQSNVIAENFYKIKASSGLVRLTTLLLCLDKLAKNKKEKQILSSTELFVANEEDNSRMNLVFNYIMNNFSKNIKLETVAEIACMTPNAFCRFFNKKTRKTLTEFIAETRVGYACKLLLQEKYSVSEISYKCGYNNISNFNRQFKRSRGCTPSSYLKRIL